MSIKSSYRQICWVCALVLSPMSGLSQATTNPAAAVTETEHPPMVDIMKKTVVFLFADCKTTLPDGSPGVAQYAGTAFLLSVADPRLGPGRSFTYLVTNRHMAQPGIEDGKPCEVSRYLVRLDSKTASANGSYSILATVPTDTFHWVFSADLADDIAITSIGVDTDKFDVVFLPSDMLLGESDVTKNRIVEGDSVLFTGLFVQFIGQVHAEPIVREGKVAMMPREKVPTTLHSLGDVYLVDSHVFGGNSGSPMFVDLAGQRDGSMNLGINYKLLGVVSGYEKEEPGFQMQAVASYAGTVAPNSGIAMVVPAQKIIDIINSSNLKQQRDAAVVALPPH
jgi:hypothetical protein